MYSPRQIIPLVLAATVYTYHWIPCVVAGLFRSITKKPVWEKTPRTKRTNTVSFFNYEHVVEQDQTLSWCRGLRSKTEVRAAGCSVSVLPVSFVVTALVLVVGVMGLFLG